MYDTSEEVGTNSENDDLELDKTNAAILHSIEAREERFDNDAC